jgi:nicotinate-nucleotide adenylyltransferase
LKPILLFGGTFDPVHCGHTEMAAAALTELDASRLEIFPAGNPYQRGRLPLVSAHHRTAMLQIAFAGTAGVSIDTRELSRTGPTYTADTLRELRRAHGDDVPLIWLIGGDAFARLDSWHQWQSLFGLAHFAVAIRQSEPHPIDAASAMLVAYLVGRESHSDALSDSPCGKYAMLAAKVPAVSSTEIRSRLTKSQSIRGFAPDRVCDYIEHHRLYQQRENT